MRLSNFSTGALIQFDGRLYRLAVRTLSGHWQAIDCETGRLTEWPIGEMEAAYVAGHLTIRPGALAGKERESPTVSVPDLSDAQQARVRFCAAFLQQMAARTDGRPASRTQLQVILALVSTELGRDKPVSVAAYYRWRKRAAQGGVAARRELKSPSRSWLRRSYLPSKLARWGLRHRLR